MNYADAPQRAIRHFNVYKGERLVLSVEDTPGQLVSVASPPPDGAPSHPFVNARAYDAFTEGDLATLLWNATTFDDFLAQLIAAGMNIASWNDSSVAARSHPHRVYRDDTLVGALWVGPGQFTTLMHQPVYDTLVFNAGLLTAYVSSEADSLLNILQKTSTFSELRQGLRESGYKLFTVAPYQT